MSSSVWKEMVLKQINRNNVAKIAKKVIIKIAPTYPDFTLASLI